MVHVDLQPKACGMRTNGFHNQLLHESPELR